MKRQMTPKSKSDYDNLKDEWYAKLKEDGFKDIEQDEQNLIRWDSHHFHQQSNPIDFEAQREYYALAGQFLYDHSFSTPWEKIVWELHAQGITTPKIKVLLKERGLVHYRDGVYKTIQRLAKIMGKQCRYKKTL